MKPAALYAMHPVKVVSDNEVKWELQTQMERGNSGGPSDLDFYAIDKEIQNIELRYYVDHCYDGERSFTLFSVWFLGQAVMICQSAGRGGQDHNENFITNEEAYRAMVSYLRSLCQAEVVEVCDADTDIPHLTDFYNDRLSRHYNPEGVEPKYAVGDIVLARVLENHLNDSTNTVETRVIIESIEPYNPTRTYHGRQLDRYVDSWWTAKFRTAENKESPKDCLWAYFSDADVVCKLS